MNLTELLEKSASAWPKKPALIEGDEVVTYAALAQKVADFAELIRAFTLSPGCRVGLSFPNGVYYVALRDMRREPHGYYGLPR